MSVMCSIVALFSSYWLSSVLPSAQVGTHTPDTHRSNSSATLMNIVLIPPHVKVAVLYIYAGLHIHIWYGC